MKSSGFKIYETEIRRLIKKAGIGGDWYLRIIAVRPKETWHAQCRADVEARFVTFEYNLNENKNLSTSFIKMMAKHEFGHFITSKLESLAWKRFVSREEINEEMEAIAHLLVKLI